MALVATPGAGMWMPTMLLYPENPVKTGFTDIVLDADEEEYQVIGPVTIDGGGTKTFGTSGSKIGWLAGATITFATGSTVRVGVKKASSVSTSAGPPARATIGAAAFDVYRSLVGGTDTIASTTWRDEAMNAGTPFSVIDGDLLAVCFHLDITSGTPNVKVRATSTSANSTNFPTHTLVTSGPTYTAQQSAILNVILGFDDGTLGWIDPTKVLSGMDTDSGAIGNTNRFGNIVRVPFSCQIDALAAVVSVGSGTADFSFDLLSTPLGTPTLIEGIAFDANVTGITSGLQRFVVRRLRTPRTLTVNTDYAIAVRQTTATAITTVYWDVADAAYFKPMGLGANCYAANSTAGATFAAVNSGRRRYLIWMRISALDDGGGGALRTSRPPKREALRFARSRA